MRAAPILAFLVACAGVVPPAPTEKPRPTTFRTYENAAEAEDPDCYQTGPCDRYVLRFPAGQKVRIELWSAQVGTVLIVDQGVGEQRAVGTPEAPAVIELDDGGDGSVRILAASSSYGAHGDYQLVVGPEPEAELDLPQPKVPWETRRARLLAEHPELAELSMTHKEARRRLREELAGYEPVELEHEASLAGFTPVTVPVVEGWCYRMVWRLREGAEYGELARRGLDAAVATPDGSGGAAGGPVLLGTIGVTPRFCATKTGDATLTITASIAPKALAAELGTGTMLLALHREAYWPGLKSEAALAAAIDEYTDGYAVARRFEIDLASAGARAFPVKRGKCYVLVLRLGEGAAWTEAAEQNGIAIDFMGEEESVSAGPGLIGPGAISALGCPQRTQTYELSMFSYGQGTAIGTGVASAKVYVRSARKGELERDARDEAERAEQSRQDDERRKREHCARCRKDHWGDQQAFESCAAQWYDRDACY